MTVAKKESDDPVDTKGSSEGNFEPLHCPEMHVNIRLLRTFGLWSLAADTKGRRAAYRLYSCAAYGAHAIFVLSVCVQLWIYRSDLEQLTDNLSVTLAHTANICKIIPLFFMRQLVEAPLRTLRGLWASAEARGAAERAVQAATLRRVRRLSAAYVGLFLFTYSVWEGTALVRSAAAARRARAANHSLRVDRQLPVRAWYPFDISPSFNYQIAFWTQSVGFFYTVTSVCTTNLLYFVLVIHATTQFRVLRASLLHVRERALGRVGAGDAHLDVDALSDAAARRLDAAMSALLGDCVRHHQATLRYADQLRTLIDPIMFAECLTMSIQLCVLIFQATTILSKLRLSLNYVFAPTWIVKSFQQPLTSPLFLSECAFLMCEMTQLFLHCYFGTELIHESLLVQDAAYESNWYSAYSSGYRKSIVIMMSRAMRESHIKAFSFSTVSLELFTGLLKASYSYYTLLRQVHEEEEELLVD